MTVEIRRADRSDVAAIWLTREDLADERRMARLPGLVASLAEQKLTPVVYRSGTEPLYDAALALLRHNRG